MPTASTRVQRRKQFVFSQNFGIGQRIHQRALAGVGIADQRDGHVIAACGNGSLLPLLNLFKFHAQFMDAFFNQPAVNFQLLFTRSTHSDTHLDTREVSPHAFQSGQRIFQLCQFDSQS